MQKRRYHHGNLRQTLVDTALLLIETKGPTGFTLSEVAKNAGVAPAAVYHHFESRNDLIAEAALQGFNIFAERMEKAYNGRQPTALHAFKAAGQSYLDFTRAHRGHYIAMFESGLSLQRSPELNHAAMDAQNVLHAAAVELSKKIPLEKRPPPQMFAAHIWALSHGVVELFVRGTPGECSPFPAEQLLERGMGIYLRGLGLIAPD